MSSEKRCERCNCDLEHWQDEYCDYCHEQQMHEWEEERKYQESEYRRSVL